MDNDTKALLLLALLFFVLFAGLAAWQSVTVFEDGTVTISPFSAMESHLQARPVHWHFCIFDWGCYDENLTPPVTRRMVIK